MQKQQKIVILGDKGMLGQMAVRYFRERSFEVIEIPHRYEPETHGAFMEALREHAGAVVINAIGRIKQKSESARELIWANALLPLDLADGLGSDQLLIQPSTDCVFSGKAGRPYNRSDHPDASDDYGWSKRLGETALLSRNNTVIFRVSIIGPEWGENPKGLLGWFLSQQPGSKLRGYVNHLWNGITTLEWCRQVEDYLARHEKGSPCRIVQLGTAESYTKYEMLRLFQEIFGTDFEISEFATEETVDKRLAPDIVSKPLPEQLRNLLIEQAPPIA